MKTEEFKVTTLISNTGCYLTQSSLKEGEERIFSQTLFLAKDALATDWRDAPQTEKEAYDVEQERLRAQKQ